MLKNQMTRSWSIGVLPVLLVMATVLWTVWYLREMDDGRIDQQNLRSVVEWASLDEIKTALGSCKTVDIRDETGWTLLMSAVGRQRVDVVELLLSRGANPNVCDERIGVTPIMIAATWGDQNIIEQLIRAGADVNHVAAHDDTALTRAIGSGNQAAVRSLLRAGAKPHDVETASNLDELLKSHRDL
jgi:ankyrin repeat protein